MRKIFKGSKKQMMKKYIPFLWAGGLYFTSESPSRLNLTVFQPGSDGTPEVKSVAVKPKKRRGMGYIACKPFILQGGMAILGI